MKIHGWGRYSLFDAEVLKPKNLYDVQKIIRQNKKVIARGLGRSYGDSANNNVVVQTNYLHNFISFDLKNGIITCEGGVSIQEINRQTIPKGWLICDGNNKPPNLTAAFVLNEKSDTLRQKGGSGMPYIFSRNPQRN